MHRIFLQNEQISDEMIAISGQEYRHMCRALRLRIGERIVICDGEGNDCLSVLVSADEKTAVFQIEQRCKNEAELLPVIRLFQCLPKGDKMDTIIQKCVELGVSSVVPVSSERCIVVLDEKKAAKKRDRWQEIALAAAKQSGRGMIPAVHMPVSFDEALTLAKEDDMAMFLYEQAEGMRSLDRAASMLEEMIRACSRGEKQSRPRISIFVGPEGGFSDEEAKKAGETDYVHTVSLGKRILRTETAGPACLSVLAYRSEVAVDAGV